MSFTVCARLTISAEQRRLDHTVGSTDLSPLAGPNGIVESAFTPSQSLRMAVALEAGPPLHALILRDLFWTLYSKLAAVLEGHRVLYEVVRWIASVGVTAECKL